jgi:hypothetical protein
MFRIGQILGDTFFLMGNLEDFIQTGLADIETYNYYFLTHKGKATSQISGGKALSLAGTGGSEENYFLAFL